MATEISIYGIGFVVRHEGFVSTAYRDVGGVWTIGTGFTSYSKTALKALGKIKAGMTITRQRNDQLLKDAFDLEYGPPVIKALPGAAQHEFDAGCSYSFNAGGGAVQSDSWTALWRQGKLADAAARLRQTRITANGKHVQGLVNRRAAEARLLEYKDYGSGVSYKKKTSEPPRKPDAELKEYQEILETLGYKPGKIDGWMGPNTEKAILAFQKNHPNLKNDGILGTATKAQLDRDLAARREGKGTAGGVAVGGGIALWLSTIGGWLPFVAVGAVALLVLWFVVRRREEVTHWIKNKVL